MDKYIDNLVMRPGASETLIESVQNRIGNKFTEDHRNFILKSNGAEGFVGKSYLQLWPLEEIEMLNQLYGMDQFMPGLILFGSDGGGMAYAIDTRQAMLSFVEVPFVGMDIKEMKICGFTFHDFLEYLSNKE
jgi:hypothetical protein